MASKKLHLTTRRFHRYLGLILGIQFLIWTVSGLYFSWTNIDEIHGDLQRKQQPPLTGEIRLVSPGEIIKNINPEIVQSLDLVNILQHPFYSIRFIKNNKNEMVLVNGETGEITPPVDKNKAVEIASNSFNGEPKMISVDYITSTDNDHEYREKPLPAWAVTFDHPTNTTVYVSANRGTVESFRNNKWRIFDFLWMGHTMGYQNRDDINNWLLRIFSIFGLVTVLSGFMLYAVSSPTFRKKKKTLPVTKPQ